MIIFNSKKFNTIYAEEYYKVITITKVAKHFGFNETEIENILDYLEDKSMLGRYNIIEKNKISILKILFDFNHKYVSELI